MTPLAETMLRRRIETRTTDWLDLSGALPRCAHFEISDIVDAAYDLAELHEAHPVRDIEWSRMPFAEVWLEFQDDDGGGRTGFYLQASQDEGAELVTVAVARTIPVRQASEAVLRMGGYHSEFGVSYWPEPSEDEAPIFPAEFDRESFYRTELNFIRAAIAIINMPKTVHRIDQPRPVRGFRRAFRRSDHPLAHQVLPGWQRITLSQRLQHVSFGLSGEKDNGIALHRVRGHWRPSRGKATWVSNYERGDAAFGIRRSFYDVNN